MKIIVFSDSHGSLEEMRAVLALESDADLVLHAGDFGRDIDAVMRLMQSKMPYKRVRGNCDYMSDAPETLLLEAEGVKILMHHGKGYGVKESLSRIDDFGRKNGADIVIFGHTHLPLIKNNGDLYLLNPGSIGWPKGAGRTYAVIEIDPKNPKKTRIGIKRFSK